MCCVKFLHVIITFCICCIQFAHIEGVMHVQVGVGHLFLQLLALTGHDCLSPVSLLSDLLCLHPVFTLFLSLSVVGGFSNVKPTPWCLTFGQS